MKKKTGLLVINLGSPDSTSVSDVRKYLNQFLMDGRVIDMPFLLRSLVVKAFIVPFRAPKSAEAYKTIWTDNGSPLKVITENFAGLVQQKLSMPIAVAMRYGNPTPAEAVKKIETHLGHLDELLIAPMYPHYAMSSYETALEYVLTHLKALKPQIKTHVLKPFYNDGAYIDALAKSIKPYLSQQEYDGYLFSYHGLPIRHLKKTDATQTHCYHSDTCCEVKSLAWDTCYKHQIKATTTAVAKKLGLNEAKVHITFQSRLGNGWIEPFTDKVLQELPQQGVKKLLVLCPAFVADCLETLEEMDDRGKELFMHNGGEAYVRVPCLNTSSDWVNAFAGYCNGYEDTYKDLWYKN